MSNRDPPQFYNISACESRDSLCDVLFDSTTDEYVSLRLSMNKD